ncbi:uncharacterized protein BCR38DRAFT_483225 [Pseudomassariella vexata]|uniref:Uncharacterized protein n=1 Tax=Pseudomassariella vexata TaxID=1141098 RepID=A0A1Y2E7U6_9PEZI|nr:uncharacterized protein BCR38DRAFT_483225 [Pseudomassariella vexata]ORY67609.1 hypothetical protein BCR38DRAFT_483225 [Pseudomassariella vexata]
MDYISALERSCHQKAVMWAEAPRSRTKQQPARASSRLNGRTNNFSYPRPDGHPPQHESADSRSSLTSNGSIPGMTDASDSEVSADDDYHYNTSATKLWDSFWPTGTDKAESIPKQQNSSRDFFTINYSPSRSHELEDDTVTITEKDPLDTTTAYWSFETPRASPPRPKNVKDTKDNRKSSYSIYPKLSPTIISTAPLPPRSSSLSIEAASAQTIRRKSIKATKSLASIHSSKSSASSHHLYLAPPAPETSSTTTISKAKSLSIAPYGDYLPVPVAAPPLRPSTSACNTCEQPRRPYPTATQHNATAPLAPLAQSSTTDLNNHHQRLVRPQLERFVSVFETDSENESDGESSGLAKRLARGLHHKKSASAEKLRGSSRSRPTSCSRDGSAEEFNNSASHSRKRGSSLGRMLGLKSR